MASKRYDALYFPPAGVKKSLKLCFWLRHDFSDCSLYYRGYSLIVGHNYSDHVAVA